MKKKKVIISCAVFLALLIVVGGGILIKTKNAEPVKDLPIAVATGDFAYDTSDINELVGYVDYVFVGEVVECTGTRHEFVFEYEGKKHGVAFTDYTIQVIENIKGELNTDAPIPVAKEGGVSIDGDCIDLFNSDSLPEAGKTYVFTAYAQTDGSLLISGPNSNVLVDDTVSVMSNDVGENPIISEYREAYENEVSFDRVRYDCIYEVQP